MNLSHHGLKYFWTEGDFVYIGVVVFSVMYVVVDISSLLFVNDFIEKSQRHGIDTISSKTLSVNEYHEQFAKIVCCLLAIFCVLFVFKLLIFNKIIHRCHHTLILVQNKIVWLLVLIYLLIMFQSFSIWYAIRNNSSLIIPASLINTFTGKQLLFHITDPTNKMGLLLYSLFCGSGFCILCAKIVHYYGIATYYTRKNFYTDDLHKYIFQKVKLFYRKVKEKYAKKSKRLKGGGNIETIYTSSTTEETHLKKEVDENVNLKLPSIKYIRKNRKINCIVTEEINKNLNIIINKLYQPDFYH